MKFNGWEPGTPDDGKNEAGTHFLATLPYTFGTYLDESDEDPSSMQLPVEQKLKAAIEVQLPGVFSRIIVGHGGETLPEEGDYLMITANLPKTETEGYPDVDVRFQVMTDVIVESTRANQIAVHTQRVGQLINMFNWTNFDTTMGVLNT